MVLIWRLAKRELWGLLVKQVRVNYHSTLLILNLIPKPPGVIESGMIYLDGENVLEKTEKELEQIRGNDVAMIFQDPMTALNPVMTVGEQIAESIMLHQDVSKAQAL